MKSMRTATVLLLAEPDNSPALAERLCRLAGIEVCPVTDRPAAERLCEQLAVDLCIVVANDTVLDRPPAADLRAPGERWGVPSLLVVPVPTAYARRQARVLGYAGVIAADLTARTLYRRIGAALQKRRAARREPRRRVPAKSVQPAVAAITAKPTYH